MARRSSSSMAILGLLGIDTWTPYGLVQHMKRSTIHYIWPRAESKMYEEPKRLAAAGYAKATKDRSDPKRTRYSITAAGRRVLAAWVAEPGGGLRFESEGALKVLFAENGTKDQLLATIDSMRRDALADLDRGQRVLDEILIDGAPYPNRLHQSSLIMDLLTRIASDVVAWADDTEGRVRGWPKVLPDSRMRADALSFVRDIQQRAETVVDAQPVGSLTGSAQLAASRPTPARSRRRLTQGCGSSDSTAPS